MSESAATSSGKIAVTAATAIASLPGRLLGFTLVSAAATSTITIYDDPTAATAGKEIDQFSVTAATAYSTDYAGGVVFNKGLTIAVTGTGAVAYVRYVLGA